MQILVKSLSGKNFGSAFLLQIFVALWTYLVDITSFTIWIQQDITTVNTIIHNCFELQKLMVHHFHVQVMTKYTTDKQSKDFYKQCYFMVDLTFWYNDVGIMKEWGEVVMFYLLVAQREPQEDKMYRCFYRERKGNSTIMEKWEFNHESWTLPFCLEYFSV